MSVPAPGTSPLAGLGVTAPVLAAPMAGGPTTAALVTAAARAGGLGFLAGGYKTAEQLHAQLAEVRPVTPVFGVNLFAPNPLAIDPAEYRRYAETLRPLAERYGVELPPEPVEDDDYWEQKLDLLRRDPVPVVSFTFAIPPAQVIASLRSLGSVVAATVTNAAEARAATNAGVDMLAVQGWAAGGHSATLTPRRLPEPVPTAVLVATIRDASRLPVIAAGGLATPAQVADVIHAGAAGGHGRHRAAAHVRERRLGGAPGRHRRPLARRDGPDPVVHRTAGEGDPQPVHRPVRRSCPFRLPGAAPPDQPDKKGGGRRGRPRGRAPVGGNGLSAGHHGAAADILRALASAG